MSLQTISYKKLSRLNRFCSQRLADSMFADIIDGFGSYPDHFMRAPVFCGLGAVAFKYYMLFQHQSVPDETTADEPSWLLGSAPGPYINELGRSVFMFLGKRVAFLGLDCRTERMVRLSYLLYLSLFEAEK